jgi:hypothetical protein
MSVVRCLFIFAKPFSTVSVISLLVSWPSFGYAYSKINEQVPEMAKKEGEQNISARDRKMWHLYEVKPSAFVESKLVANLCSFCTGLSFYTLKSMLKQYNLLLTQLVLIVYTFT